MKDNRVVNVAILMIVDNSTVLAAKRESPPYFIVSSATNTAVGMLACRIVTFPATPVSPTH